MVECLKQFIDILEKSISSGQKTEIISVSSGAKELSSELHVKSAEYFANPSKTWQRWQMTIGLFGFD